MTRGSDESSGTLDTLKVDVAQALAVSAAKLGEGFLHLPYPGEPGGMDPAIRPSLWSMRIVSDAHLQERLRHRTKALEMRIACRTILIVLLSGIVSAGARILDVPFHDPISAVAFAFGLFAFPMTWRSRAFSRSCYLSTLPDEAMKLTWPSKLADALSMAKVKGMTLSQELSGLASMLADHPVECWSRLSLEASASMAALGMRLREEAERALPGSLLTLGGEASELVHHACEAGMPGCLEAAIHRQAVPPVVKVG